MAEKRAKERAIQNNVDICNEGEVEEGKEGMYVLKISFMIYGFLKVIY